MNALALSLTPSISSNKTFLIKGFIVKERKRGEGGGGVAQRANKNEHAEERGHTYLYAHSVKKNCLIFQTTNRVPSNRLLVSC